MSRRVKQVLAGCVVAAGLVGGGATVAFAQTSPNTSQPPASTPSTGGAPAQHGSANCPNM
jgi:hypothetical protein